MKGPSEKGSANMHHDLWSALRRVARGESPGSSTWRELLIDRGLIEWVPFEGGMRLTRAGRLALAQGEGR